MIDNILTFLYVLFWVYWVWFMANMFLSISYKRKGLKLLNANVKDLKATDPSDGLAVTSVLAKVTARNEEEEVLWAIGEHYSHRALRPWTALDNYPL